MTEREMQNRLCTVGNFSKQALWDARKVICACNPGMAVPYWDADLLIIQDSGIVHEIEIKCSLSDFRRDKNKRHRTFYFENPEYNKTIVQRFSYAIPSELQAKIEPELPSYAGLIVVPPEGRPVIVRKPKPVGGRKATDADRVRALMSASYENWKTRGMHKRKEAEATRALGKEGE